MASGLEENLSAPRGESATRAALVGRQRELQVFDMLLRELLDGAGSGLVLTGEAGIGKTRLLRAMQARATGVAQVFETRCLEGITAPAFAPWLHLLGEFASWADHSSEDEMAAAARRWAAQVAQGGEERDFAVDSRFALFEELANLVRRFCRIRPVVLCFDDIHLADPASVIALRTILARVRDARLLVLVTCRDGRHEGATELTSLLLELGQGGRRLALAGLGPSEVAEFLAADGHAVNDMVVETLWRRSGGNPFFLREIIGCLKDSVDPGALPPAARDAVLQRLHPLEPSVRAVVDAAAVLGDEAQVSLLQAMLDLDSSFEVLERLQRAREMNLVGIGDDRHEIFTFRHAIVREAIYDAIPVSRRARLHAAAARGLRQAGGEDDPDRLGKIVHHALCALPEGDTDEVVRLTCRAAETAARSYAYERAATYLRSALDSLPPLADASRTGNERNRLELLLQLAAILERCDHRKHSREAYREACDLARRLDDPANLARAVIGLYPRGDISVMPDPESLAAMREALAQSAGIAPALRVELLGRLAKAQYYSADLAVREELATKAVEIAEASGDDFLVATARVSRHFATWGPEEESDGGRAASHGEELGRQVGDPDVVFGSLFWRLTDAIERGDVASAETDIEQFGALAETRREPFYLWRASVFRAARMLLTGRFLEAERAIAEAHGLGEEAASPNVGMTWGVQRAFLLQERGDGPGALELLRRVADAMGGLPAARCLLLGGLVQAGETGEARELFARLAAEDFALRSDQSWATSMVQLARACVELGEPTHAETLLERLAPFADRIALVGWLDACEGSLGRWVGRLAQHAGHPDLARRHLRHALEGNRRMGAWPHVARTQCDLARLLQTTGSEGARAEAANLAQHAFETAKRLGMESLASQARELGGESAASRRPSHPESRPQLSRDGDFFRAEFAGRSCTIKDARGVRYLAFLLEHPREGVHVLDLRLAAGGHEVPNAAAGPYASMGEKRLDAEGLRRLRQGRGPREKGGPQDAARDRSLLRALREELASTEADGDGARTALLAEEIDRVSARLMDRYSEVPAEVERARKAVTNAIRYSIGRIRRIDPALGRHLDFHVRTGTFCAYEP